MEGDVEIKTEELCKDQIYVAWPYEKGKKKTKGKLK